MSPEKIEVVPLMCEIAVWLIFVIGVTCALFVAVQPHIQKGRALLPALGTLRARPFTLAHAVPVIALTGLFALLGALHTPDSNASITPEGCIRGITVCSVAGLFTVALCVLMTQKGLRAVFGSATCTWQTAVGKGFLYGFAAIPAVTLVWLVVKAASDALDLDMAPQDVFMWFQDPAFTTPVRVALVFFAIVVAPVTEELLFRGILLPALMKGRDFAFAALLCSFYFALIHLHGPSLLSLMALGITFSVGYAATGSILTPIVMHAVFNLNGFLLFFSSTEPVAAWFLPRIF